MMWIALLMALVLSLAAVAYVVWPLLKPGPAPIMVEDDRLTELLGRKDAVLKAIKDLEFDYHVGKLSEEDYLLYDQRLRRQAIGLLQQIEQVAPLSASLDTTLELEVARRRRTQEPQAAPAARPLPTPAAAPAVVAGPVAVGVAVATAGAAAPAVANGAATPALGGSGMGAEVGAVRFCTNCGSKLEPQHKFCANCGTPVVV